ncbi:MAG: hypothetical protein EOO89_08870 [Pedobacter sp.]|nr:MAG: hypothetical protein EOO89_08870 [Pedobacter sp.]
MKSKQPIPVFTAVVMRVLPLRFTQLDKVQSVSDCNFKLLLKSKVDSGTFADNLDQYLIHLLSEFADPDTVYNFQLLKGKKLISKLVYNKPATNKIAP